MTRAEDPVYIVKSKVDLKLKVSGALAVNKIVQPRQSDRVGDSEDLLTSSESSDVGSQSVSPGLS